MKFPEHWSKATADDVAADGQKVSFSCWRWSDKSQQDAQASALAAAQRLVRRLAHGEELQRYPYGRTPLREEVLQRLTNDQGELIAAVTQNLYGSLVLNTSRVMFIDIDFPPTQPGAHLRGFFKKFRGKNVTTPEDDARLKVEQFLGGKPEWSCRIYRTLAGLRVLVTHALFDPDSDATRKLLESAGADPLYVRLCQAQRCFRARLTPKPWRCGYHSNTVGWPREGDQQQREFDAWQAKYLERQAKYATCRFLTTIGHETVHSEAAPIIELHDRLTRCHEAWDLA